MSYLQKKAYALAITIISLFFSFSVSSQNICGTQAQELLELPFQLLNNNSAVDIGNTDSITFLAIKIHLVQDDSAFSEIGQKEILQEIEEVNEYFKDAKLQFYLYDSINFINNSNLYTYEIAEDELALSAFSDENVINVFFVKSINASTTPFAAYTYLPPGPDAIFMTEGSALYNKTTLAHEIGHYLGLYHTHGLFNRKLTNELVDGSNCNIAGDMICDTPADPNLLGKMNLDCEYTGKLTDANGDFFEPDVKNIMSYSLDKCCEHFSAGQFQRMLNILEIYRAYLIRYKEPLQNSRIEIEEHFQVLEERGNKSTIEVFGDFISDNDEGKAVTLFDIGDRLKVDFNIQESATYLVKVRLRSGFTGNPTRYWPQGYDFAINDSSISIIGDTASVSALYSSFGGAHWGVMQGEISLDSGTHSFSISSALDWGAVDYIEVEKVKQEEEEEDVLLSKKVEIEDVYSVLADPGNKSDIVVFNELIDGESDGKAVTLFDQGDKIAVDFRLEKRAKYVLGVRVRSGHSASATRYWPNGYQFMLDSIPVTFLGDTSTLSDFHQSLGGAYWGTMKLESILDTGKHTLSIKSRLSWSAVDYLSIDEVKNYAPTDILLSNSVVEENNQIGDFIALLSALDLDEADSHKFELVEGEGSDDNFKFTIRGDSLFCNAIFDYEQKGQYAIRIRTEDKLGAAFEKALKVDIQNIYDSYVTFSLSSLRKIYNGLPQTIDVVSEPQGVSFELTYNGEREVPTNAGIYQINVQSTNPEYEGSLSDTLRIEKAMAGLSISNLEQEYDGKPKAVEVFSEPQGLNLIVTYNGQDTLPIAIGEYEVNATVQDQNYKGADSATLSIITSHDTTSSHTSNQRIADFNLESKQETFSETLEQKLDYFPNPTTDLVTLDAKSLNKNKASIIVFDSKGKHILSLLKPEDAQEVKIDLTAQPNGTYLIYYVQDLYNEVIKVMKQ